MGFLTKKRSNDVGSHARNVIRGLRIARGGDRRSNMHHNESYRASQAPGNEMLSFTLGSEKREQDPFHHIGKSTEYRAVESRAGHGGTRRKRRSRKDQCRKGDTDGALTAGENSQEAKGDSKPLGQCSLVAYRSEERPVYWKLLQKVLANLGLTEEEWREKYVRQ